MALTAQQFFEARPESISQARFFTSEALTDWGLPDRVEDIRLCVSELATNAMVHGTVPGHGFLVKLDAEEETVRMEVHDSRRRHPKARQAAHTDTSGRGLIRVDMLADGWGVQDRTPCGKIVWCCFKAAGSTTA
ncbi:ATP-binding protein [Streptomyces anulatus]|uniref:ATP-binding protein n=1 Tax=Streptomyces anulatus TaxID=1892 RepID=UPI001C265E6C|nr:ATP-binding protein [Streptomyces anulatus]